MNNTGFYSMMRKILKSIRVAIFLLLAGCGASQELSGPQRIVFFGDSITQLGERPGGYVALVRDSLLRGTWLEGSVVINAGISGHKVTDLQKRLSRDVLEKNPTVVVIYIGINDVWHSALPNHRGTPKDTFGIVLKEIIQLIRATKARVMLCTPTVIGEKKNGENPQDAMLDEYAEVSRTVAKELGIPLCDLRALFTATEKNLNADNSEKGVLTADRVHLNATGNKLVANEIVRMLQLLR